MTGLLGWQAAVRLDAAQVLAGQTPILQGFSADVLLRDGTVTIPRMGAQLNGGTLSGAATLAAASEPPRLTVRGSAAGVALPGPVLETAVDATAGQVDATLSALYRALDP